MRKVIVIAKSGNPAVEVGRNDKFEVYESLAEAKAKLQETDLAVLNQALITREQTRIRVENTMSLQKAAARNPALKAELDALKAKHGL